MERTQKRQQSPGTVRVPGLSARERWACWDRFFGSQKVGCVWLAAQFRSQEPLVDISVAYIGKLALGAMVPGRCSSSAQS